MNLLNHLWGKWLCVALLRPLDMIQISPERRGKLVFHVQQVSKVTLRWINVMGNEENAKQFVDEQSALVKQIREVSVGLPRLLVVPLIALLSILTNVRSGWHQGPGLVQLNWMGLGTCV